MDNYVKLRDPFDLDAPTPADTNSQFEWSDYPKEALSTAANIGAGVMSLSRKFNELRGDDLNTEAAKIYQDKLNNYASETDQSLSDAAKNVSVFKNPAHYIALKGAQMAPYFAAAALPGGIVGDAFGAVAGTATAFGTGAAINAGAFINEVDKGIDKADDKTLKSQSDYYAGLRDRMPESQARQEFKDYILNKDGRLALEGLVGGVTNILGPAGQAGRAMMGGKAALNTAEKGIVGNFISGATEAGGAMGVQTGLSNADVQNANIDIGNQSKFDYGQWTRDTLEAMGLGIATGGVLHAVFNGKPKEQNKPNNPIVETMDVKTPDAAQTAALNGVTSESNTTTITKDNLPPDAKAALEVSTKRSGSSQAADAIAALDKSSQDQTAPPTDQTAPPTDQNLPPVKDQGKTVPETKEQFDAQVADLVDPENDRAAVLFPKGTKAVDRPDLPEGMKKVFTKDGMFYYDPARLKPKDILEASKDGRLNEILSMGDTSKTKAMNDVANGAEPAMVVLRDENGTPKVEAASSSDTAQNDANQIAAKGNPTDTVEVTNSEAPIIERIQSKAAEAAAGLDQTKSPTIQDRIAEQRAARLNKITEDQSTNSLGGKTETGGRILENLRQSASEKEEVNRVTELNAQDIKDRAKKLVAMNEESNTKTKAMPSRVKTRKSNNNIADSVVNNEVFLPATIENNVGVENKVRSTQARKAILERVQAMVRAAEKAGFKMPNRIKGQLDPEAKHNGSAVVLREAQDLLNQKNPSNEHLIRYVLNEALGRAGHVDAITETRLVEGGQKKTVNKDAETQHIVPKEGTGNEQEQYLSPQEALEKKQEAEAKLKEDMGFKEGEPIPKETTKVEETPTEPTSSDEPSATGYGTKEGTFKVTTAKGRQKNTEGRPAVTGKINLSPRSLIGDSARVGKPTTRNTNVDPKDVVDSYTLSNAIRHADMSEFEGHEFGPAQGIVTKIMHRIEEAVGKVEVVVVKQSALDAMDTSVEPSATRGMYDPNTNKIYISEHEVRNGQIDAHTLAHEGVHALIQHVLEVDATFHNILSKMAEDVRRLTPGEEHYGLTIDPKTGKVDIHEFVAEALTNPDFQSLLSSIKVSPRIREALELDTRTGSMWDGLVASVQKYVLKISDALGFNNKDYNMLSAVMRVAEQLDQKGVEARGIYGIPDTSMQSRPLIGKRGRELLDKVKNGKTDVGGILRSAQRATDTMAMIVRRAKSLGENFGAAAGKVDELVQRMDRARSKLLEREGGGHEIVTEGDQLSRKYGDKFDDLLDVMFRASELNVNLAKEGEVANNEHLGKDATSGWQGKKQQVALENKFRALPEELQDWALKATDYGRQERNAQSFDVIKTILKSAGIEEPGLAERIHSDGVTDADKLKFKTDKIINHLDRVSDLKKISGWYVPFMREGDYVVAGKRSIGDIPKGNHVRQIDENTVQFTSPKGDGRNTAARKEAEKYATSHELPVMDVKHVFVDKNDPTRILEKENVDAIDAYRVRLQNDHFELMKSESEANTRAEELKSQGMSNVYTDLLKQNPNGRWGGVMPSQYESVIRSLTSRDSFKGLPKDQQNSVIQAMHEANIRLLPGTRIQKTNLQRKNVAGYSRDLVQSMARYADMSSRYRAKLQYQPEIDQQLKNMADYIDKNRDDKSIQRREILREMETRIHNSDQSNKDSTFNNFSRRLRQVSMLDKLAGPSFHIINSMEPWTTSLPYIGGRHGLFNTMGSLKEAYTLIGAKSGVISGLKDTVKAFSENSGLTNYLDAFKDEITKNASPERSARLKNVLDYLDATNLLGNEAGMEMHRIASPSTNMLGRGFDRADLMARQMGQAIEAINRSTTGLAAYELEFKRTSDHAKSLEYARDAVDITMGNYSMSNAAPVFNSSLGALALQFKKFAQKTYYLVGKTLGAAIKGDREAQKQFAGLMFTHAVMAGALGLPLEPIKAALTISNVLGISGFTYGDFEQAVRTTFANLLGKQVGEAFSRGLPRLIGIDLSRMSLADLMVFGAPHSTKMVDLKSWLFDTMAGAPVGEILQQIQGAQALANGDVRGAAEKMIPLKFARDINQAVSRFVAPQQNKFGKETMSNYTLGEAGLRAIGIKPGREAELQEMRSAVGGDTFSYNQQRADLIRAWVSADPSNRAKQMIAISKFNSGKPSAAQISSGDLAKAKQSSTKSKANETDSYGLRFSKRDAYLKPGIDLYNVR